MAGGKSGQHGAGGRLWEPYMGRTGGAHSILLTDGILWNIVYFVFFLLINRCIDCRLEQVLCGWYSGG